MQSPAIQLFRAAAGLIEQVGCAMRDTLYVVGTALQMRLHV